MGEECFEPRAVVVAVQNAVSAPEAVVAETWRVTTPGGRFQVRWDENGSATALGQFAFFAEFLGVLGVVRALAGRLPHGLHESQCAVCAEWFCSGFGRLDSHRG